MLYKEISEVSLSARNIFFGNCPRNLGKNDKLVKLTTSYQTNKLLI